MNDSYQAVYDATRSKISTVNTHEVIYSAARDAFDISHARALLQEQIGIVGFEMVRPSAIYRPALSLDGSQWCALYGSDLMDGVAGFGDTPEDAMRAFDQAWRAQKTPDAIRAEREANSQFGVGA